MLKVHLYTGTAFTTQILLPIDINGDIIGAIDEFYYTVGAENFPVRLYRPEEFVENDVDTFIAINGGEYYMEGIAYVEEVPEWDTGQGVLN